MRYLMTLSYDGTNFSGYQKQVKERTVQGELEKVLKQINDNKKVEVHATGRTDAKVHAINQKAHFDMDTNIPIDKLMKGINSLLPEDIYVKKIENVSEDFHARFNAIGKEYIYKINMGEYNPIEKNYVYQYCKSIDKELLDIFINQFKGIHNYRSFTSDKDNGNYERDVIIDYKISKKVLYLRFESSGFLRYMIRNIVGLLLDINDNKKSICDIEDIFNKMDRTSLGRCASAVGLYLNKIEY